MTFPTLFFGEPHDKDIEKGFSYQKISQWELQNSNRAFAHHTTNLFFKIVKILIAQVFSTIWIRIHKGKLNDRILKVKDVKCKPNLDKIL